MIFLTATLLGIALAADAFAVAISLGLKSKRIEIKEFLLVGVLFGGFQGLMPCIGFYLGSLFTESLFKIGNIITFTILMIIAIKTFFFSDKEEPLQNKKKLSSKDMKIIDNNKALSINIGYLFFLAIITSIDALSIGVALALDHQSLVVNCIFITIITFLLSLIGVLFGKKLGEKYQKIASKISGLILAFLAIKALLP